LSKFGVRVRSIPSIIDITSGKSKISEIHNLNINELVGREEIQPNLDLMKKNIQNKIILITGAGGSIGSELCRQIMFLQPKQIILIENTENSLYLIYEELKKLSNSKVQKYSNNTTLGHNFSSTIIYPYLSSVCDYDSLMEIFKMHKPHVVFHAAAYKHVPLLEQNFFAGVRNNVFGTLVCAQASIDSGVSNFTLVSSDKAVRPTNIMGATKRISELILQAITDSAVNKNGNLTIFSIVRFGNVIGSSGSAIPLFIDQIAAGGPVTLTDMNITRYFMTIPEAAQLLIQANGMAVGGEIFILDMGEPIRLYDLITKMINFSGFLVKDDTNPHGDIEIKICGLRPGEKLHEELFIGTNPEQTHHPKIMKVNDESVKWEELKSELDNLAIILDKFDKEKLFEVIQKLVPEYNRHKNNLI
jgi:FlaA1/EpsC-like NDP-sugar epimerase